MITAHGWFSYEVRVKPDRENAVSVEVGSNTDTLCMKVIIGDDEYTVNMDGGDKRRKEFIYRAKPNEKKVRIRFEKISANVPCVYTVTVK
jgi:hypothetical protein